jgi:nucleotide-binding universal stress UspA family protein
MKKILVPTDFSPIADNAFRYAIEIASVLGSEILLHHAYTLDRFNFNLDFPRDKQPYAREMERKMRKKMQGFQAQVDAKGVGVETKVEEEDIFSLFNRKAIENEIELIIMGTKGASGVKGGVFGSVAAAALDSAEVPVLLIPPDRTFSSIENVVLATDHKGFTANVVAPLRNLVRHLDAEVTLLNVKDGNEAVIDAVHFEGVKTSFKEVPMSGSINESINDYICKEGCDLLCMIRRRKSLLESFFQKSITKTQVFENQVPLLVLPDH